MKNYITIFPYDRSLPEKKRALPQVKSSRCQASNFEFDIQRLKIRMKNEGKSASKLNSPRSLVSAHSSSRNTLDTLIDKANEVTTSNLREFLHITQKDLIGKVNELKQITKLDVDEYREQQAQRLRQRRFIKADEREIRLLIKQDTLKHNFNIK